MTELTEHAVDFHGDEITSVRSEDGTVYVPVKRLCEQMGIDHNRQTSKMKNDERFNCRHIPITAVDGKYRVMLCLPLAEIEGWLLSVNANKVRSDLRDKLVRYQQECFQVLHDYWTKGAAVNPRIMELDDATVETIVNQAVERSIVRFGAAEAFDPRDLRQKRSVLLQQELDMLTKMAMWSPALSDWAQIHIQSAEARYHSDVSQD